MPIFGNTEVGDSFDNEIATVAWGGVFEAPEDGYAKSITVYLWNRKATPARVRAALYDRDRVACTEPFVRTYPGYIMATEEVWLPAGFMGWQKFNFTAPPPISRGNKYILGAWAGKDTFVSMAKVKGVGESSEFDGDRAIGLIEGLFYPRFHEIAIGKSWKATSLFSVYCEYDFEAPATYKCPFCDAVFGSFEEVYNHNQTTLGELLHLFYCCIEGQYFWLECELEKHLYEEHGIGSMPTVGKCCFCDYSLPVPTGPSERFPKHGDFAGLIYEHINDAHDPFAPVPIHMLSIRSNPIHGVPVKIAGADVGVTPVSRSLVEGEYLIEVPQEVTA